MRLFNSLVSTVFLSVWLCGVALLLTACKPDSPAPKQLSPLIFYEAFETGSLVHMDGERFLFRAVDLGEINLPSGELVGGDPTIEAQQPYTTTVPAGKHHITLSVAHGSEHTYTAFARIEFSDHEVDHWRMATRPGQSLEQLNRGEIFGLVVRSGLVFFMDYGWYNDIGDNASAFLQNVIQTRFNAFSGFSNVRLEGGKNLLVVATPKQEGTYAGYFGYDAKGNVAAFLLDFYVIPWAEQDKG